MAIKKTPRVFLLKAKIIDNVKIKKNFYKIKLFAPQIAGAAYAGQFVEVKVSDWGTPFLRRPFSLHKVNPAAGTIELLYEVVGEGSRLLSCKRPKDQLDVIGPLGKGFCLPPAGCPAILVAGGMGAAPLLLLCQRLGNGLRLSGRQARHAARAEIIVLLGARDKEGLLCEQEFRESGGKVMVATDDASKGFKGYVSGLLKDVLLTLDYGAWSIYACGPKPMLKQVSAISRAYNIPAQLSLEAHMSCGFGACLGCVVDTADGQKRVCKEGPVFTAQEIVW